jgi:imidazolonepropionase-like amidohydrolase
MFIARLRRQLYPSKPILVSVHMRTGGSLSLSVGKLIIGDGRTPENADVGIKDGEIVEVTTGRLGGEYEETVDLSDRVVMPGLIDAHVHIKYAGRPDPVEDSDEYLAIRGVELARRALMAGVTSMADAGAVRNVAFAVRNAINDGVALGPRLFVCGEMITMTGGRSTRPGLRLEVDGADSARRAARTGACSSPRAPRNAWPGPGAPTPVAT